MKKTKMPQLLIAALLAICILAGCSEKPAQDNSSASQGGGQTASQAADSTLAQKTEVRVSLQASGHSVPVYYGLQNLVFEDLGLELKTLMFANGPAQNEALGADEWDIGCTGGMPSVLGGKAYDLKVIAYAHPDMKPIQIWARPDSPVAQEKGKIDGYPEIYGTPELWKGKKIICNTGASTHFGLIAVLDAMGLQESDVEIIHMDVPASLAAFKAGEGDLVVLWDPQNYDAIEEGWIKVASLDITSKVLPTVLVAPQSYLEKNEDAVVKFLEGYMESQVALMADQPLYIQTLLDYQAENGVKLTDELAKDYVEARPYPSVDEQIAMFDGDPGSTEMDQVMNDIMDFMISNGLIEPEDKEYLNQNTFVDGSYVLKAAENLKNRTA